MGLFLFFSIDVVYPEERACKGCNLAKADEERLMDLSVWLYEHAAEEHRQPSQGEHRRCDELYCLIIHKTFDS